MPGLDDINGEGLGDDELLVYIAGPYTNGSWGSNIKDAIDAAQVVYNLGHVPFIPHTMASIWSVVYTNNWIRYDLKWLDVCDVLIRLPGESEGSETEVEFAENNGIDVYYGLSEFIDKYTVPKEVNV